MDLKTIFIFFLLLMMVELKIFTFNVRGLHNNAKRDEIFDMFKSFKRTKRKEEVHHISSSMKNFKDIPT